jgi:hypothetical protein
MIENKLDKIKDIEKERNRNTSAEPSLQFRNRKDHT